MKYKHSTIERELEEQGRVLVQTVGISMEPLLHNRKSTAVIEKITKPIKKYDAVLFLRPEEEYVLHRVVKVRPDDCLICGDNCIFRELVPKEKILGVMTGFYPDESGCFISCDDKKYRRYIRTWEFRYGIRWVKALPGRIRRKVFR